MKKLTKREKVLIYILICFGLLMGGFYLVVNPSYQKYQTLSTQVAEAELNQSTTATAIDSVPAVMKTRDEANVKLSGLKGPFSAHLPNEGLDILLTQLCLDYNLAPKVLTVGSNAWAEVVTFVEAPPVYATTPGQVVAGGNTQTTTEVPTGTTGSTGGSETWTGVVTMELTGTQSDFQRLVDAVDARPDMIISSFAIAPNVQLLNGQTTSGNTTTTTSSSGWTPELDGGNIIINVTFTVYMVDK